MPDRDQAPTSQNDSSDCSLSFRWTDNTFARTAEMIAAGEMEFPQHIGGNEKTKLEDEVRDLRRKRLVRFVAGLIAAELADDASNNWELDHD